MAIITKSIGTSSRDYSTVQAWEDSIPASMGSDSYVGECYKDSEFSVSASDTLTFSGSTTGASNTITLKCATGQSFRDNASVQTNALRYNSANGVAVKNTKYAARTCVVSEDYVTITGIQFAQTFSGTVLQESGNYTHNKISNCILDLADTSGNAVMSARGLTVINCLMIQNPTGRAIDCPYHNGSLKFVNCTIVHPTNRSASTTYCFRADYATVPITNCAIFGFNSICNIDSRFGGSNNCSDKAIGFGTSNQASKTYANQFVNTSSSTADFKIKTGADCYNNGVTDTSASPDIAGTTRPQSTAYDIGCWELVVSGGSTPNSIESDLIIFN